MLVCGALYSSCRSAQNGSATAPADVPAQKRAPDAATSTPIRASIGFASREKFVQHYEKHGREFGTITREEYLRQAQTLRDRPAGGDILESVRADGVVTRFDRATGSFLACNADGVIRTFFRPNDGEAYFRRQARRRPRNDE